MDRLHRRKKVMTIFDAPGIDPGLSELLERELEEVSTIFDLQLASEFSPVNNLCLHVGRYRGKMLRPMLVLLSGGAVRNMMPLGVEHRTIAAVCEMIHMATLVHDDVLDESSVRRGGPTVNALHGNDMAVMLGDYLISNAFHMCSTLGNPEINRRLGEVTNTLCEGEIVQLFHREDLEVNENLYFTIVRRKTASLIGACCELGGMLAGADQQVSLALRQYGIDLGVAFQITDDLLDVAGNQQQLGKSIGRDLDMGKLTLPLIRAIRESNDADRRSIIALVKDRCHAQLRERLMEDGWIASAHRTATDLVKSARRSISELPDNNQTSMLHVLADAVVDRQV